MRSRVDIEMLDLNKNTLSNRVIRTPNLILYYPSLTSLVSVLIRFMGIFSALLILVVLFCIVLFQGTNFVLCFLWIFEISCFLNLSVMALHVINAGFHLFKKGIAENLVKRLHKLFKQ